MMRCSAGRGKNSSSVLPLIEVDAGARLEDHARDGRLALAGRAVARVGGELDDRGDRLVGDDVLVALGAVLALGRLVGVLAVLVAGGCALALEDDVDLEVGARDGGLDARRGILGRSLLGGRRLGGSARPPRRRASSAGASSAAGLGDGLLGCGASSAGGCASAAGCSAGVSSAAGSSACASGVGSSIGVGSSAIRW